MLIQYPRPGAWTIAFQTGTPTGKVADHIGSDMVSVYVPAHAQSHQRLLSDGSAHGCD